MTMAAAEELVHARAPGKINLFMRVGALDVDGYHDVATAYQAVSLYEDVRAYPDDGFSVAFRGTIDTSGLPTDRTNLAVRAARLLARHAGVRSGVRLEIEKHVPIAGGMGGGSADAAATLVACDALWGTGLPREDLHSLAAQLGADVPFSLTGGTAIGTGRGDRLSPALATGTFEWVLALADFGLSTPAVYGELDRLRAARGDRMAKLGSRSGSTARSGSRSSPASRIADTDDAGGPTVDADVLHALRAGDPQRLADALHNDLQPAALSLAPSLRKLLELGETNGALAGMVSGSGPTLAFLVDGTEAAMEAQIALSTAGLRTLHVHGPVGGARVLPA